MNCVILAPITEQENSAVIGRKRGREEERKRERKRGREEEGREEERKMGR